MAPVVFLLDSVALGYNLMIFSLCLDTMICQMLLTFLYCVSFTTKQGRGIGSLVSLSSLGFICL